MGGRSISPEHVRAAKEMRAQGYTLQFIARHLGRSRSGIERVVGDPCSQGKLCADCGVPISNVCKTDTCRSCCRARRNRDEVETAKRAAGRRRAIHADPRKYAEVCMIARQNIRKAMSDPATRARFVELGKIRAAMHFNTPEGRARANAPEVRARAAAGIREARIGWCPEEYRDDYRRLTVDKRLRAAEARAIIEAQIAADQKRAKRAVTNLSPFERQMRALENGARLVANDQKPSLANPGFCGAAA